MKRYDVIVIGGGLLGCFAARELMRYELSAALAEKREDVCTGISKANTAIVYPGYDHKPGTLKARMTRRANASFGDMCAELHVPFERCGSLMVSLGERADAVLKKKLENGLAAGVPGLRLISGAEARETEPALTDGICSALYSPTAGTVDPWELCYAAFENAKINGCQWMGNTEALGIRRENGGYVLETDAGEMFARAVVNCAGLHSDRVHEMLFEPSVRIFPDGADYMILERGSGSLRHIIQHESEENGKGITAVPTVGGGILLGDIERESVGSLSGTSSASLENIRSLSAKVLTGLADGNLIRCFAAARPNPHGVVFRDGEYVPDGKSIGSFVIENPEPGFISFIGIKTPGLTCARELGALAAGKIAEHLGAELRTDFKPEREPTVRLRDMSCDERAAVVAVNGDYGEILCQCEDISRAEVLEAIRRGAVTVDGVKRRCGAMLGACQGSRCQQGVAELISQALGIPVDEVTKSGGNSYITGGRHG